MVEKGKEKKEVFQAKILGVVAIVIILGIALTKILWFTPVVEAPVITELETYYDNGDEACTKNDKPIVRMFSTTTCSHCNWIKSTFDGVVFEYVEDKKIVAYHWELDTGDNTLTPASEDAVPASEVEVYKQFNPRTTVPTFVLGCKYYRIENGYESKGDEEGLLWEEAELRFILDKLVNESS